MPNRLILPTILTAGLALGQPTIAHAQEPSAPEVIVDADGTVHIPPMSVPLSSLLSDEGRDYLLQHLLDMQNPQSKVLQGNDLPFFLEPYLAAMEEQFPLERQDIEIAGVPGIRFTPPAELAAAHEGKILINLHGGGFSGCYPGCAIMESLPLAAIGGYDVITLDYRQGPDHTFPAASEDVAAVYRELLTSYEPQDIGIYGCSAGGMLVGMSLAWFANEGLPMPGAAGIFCAGLTVNDGPGFGGDADFVVSPIGEGYVPAEAPPPIGKALPPIPYLANASITDPLVAPANDPDLLAQFPPTLFITGTRAFELSSAVYSHGQLVKAGVESDLHVWDGMFHGFFMNPDVPESREAFDVMVNFFDDTLGQ